ncbi:MAG TPA: LptF/LptG family permease [Myxococcaceae bacterium]|nr:LptF/LptG family permease [Myxococcaceae bacterium]
MSESAAPPGQGAVPAGRLPLLMRAVARELGGALGVWVAFLFLLLFVMQFLRGTDVLLGSAVTVGDYLLLAANLAPHFLVMALPVGLLLAVLLGLGRMAEDRELLALGALGSPPWEVARVALGLAAALGVVTLVLGSSLEPWGLKQVKRVVGQVIKRNVLGDVKPGVFYEDLTDLTLYARGVDPGRAVWTQVLVHDERDPRAPLLVLAREGRVRPEGPGGALTVALRDGEVHRAEHTGGDYALLTFDRGELAVGVEDSLLRKNRLTSPIEELTPAELLAAASEARAGGRSPAPFLTAFHLRLASGLTPLAFALLGIPLAMRLRRARGRAYLLTLTFYVLFYVVQRSFENWGSTGRLSPFLAAQGPNLVFGGAGVWAMRWLEARGVTA